MKPHPPRYKRKDKRKQDRPTEPTLRPLQAGKVTRVHTQKHDFKRVSVYIDEEFAFGLLQDIAIQHFISPGKHLEIEEQQALLDLDQEVRAKMLAVEFLSYKARTEGEVRRKLNDKGFNANVIEKVLERFRNLGYLNDESYARSFAKSRLTNKGYGPQRIRQDLNKRGISRELINETLQELEETEDPMAAILVQAEKRWQRLESERSLQRRKKKVMDFLLRRGFSYALVKRAIEQVQQDFPHETEEPPPLLPSEIEDSVTDIEEMPENDPMEEILALAEKRWDRLQSEKNTRKRKKKVTDFLLRRGFSYSLIKEALAQVQANTT